MEQPKIIRLNILFEKMVGNSANHYEQNELKALYQEYINEGREYSDYSPKAAPITLRAIG